LVTPPSDIPKNPLDKNVDLTSTLNISALRSVPDFLTDTTLIDSLTSEEFNILKDLEKDSAMFISLAGPGKGARFLLDSDLVTIGRDVTSEIFLDDVTVSRKHCQVIRSKIAGAVTFEIEDLKSLNGTYINAISKAKTSLNHGDEVQVGKYRLTFLRPLAGAQSKDVE